MGNLQVVVIDQHPVVEEGLELLLRDDPEIRITRTASAGEEGLQLLRQSSVDVVVIDPHLPDIDGEEIIRLIKEQQSGLPIVVFSEQDEEIAVYNALKAGARGYILKSAPLCELVSAIREVHSGGYALSTSLSPTIIKFYLEHRDQGCDQLGDYQALTEREKQVFRLLAMGHQTREIAELLYISPKTVAKHRVAVKKKLSLDSSAEMAQYAIQLGLISVAED